MKILVTVKKVVDYNVKVRAKADNSDVDIQNVKKSANPFDENAVEEAVGLKEQKKADEVVVLSIGDKKNVDVIRSSLAMGADRGVLVQTDENLEPLNVAKVIKEIVQKENPDLIMMGKQAIDDDANQTPQMLSALLDYPQATYASKLDLGDDSVVVTRETDDGLEDIKVKLPCVVSADLRLNQPRYVKLPNIMKAKKKPLETIELDSLNLDIKKRLELLEAKEPVATKQVKMLDDVDELVEEIKKVM